MDRMLTTREAAAYTGLARQTLAKLRCQGGGARFYRVGGLRAVRYRQADLDDWLGSSFASTADADHLDQMKAPGRSGSPRGPHPAIQRFSETNERHSSEKP